MTMRRRDILRGSSAGLAALGFAQHTRAESDCTLASNQTANFVLVHGTRHGGREDLKPTYIHCAGQTYRKSAKLMIGPARGPDWSFIEPDIPRHGMLTHPELVAHTLAGPTSSPGQFRGLWFNTDCAPELFKSHCGE